MIAAVSQPTQNLPSPLLSITCLVLVLPSRPSQVLPESTRYRSQTPQPLHEPRSHLGVPPPSRGTPQDLHALDHLRLLNPAGRSYRSPQPPSANQSSRYFPPQHLVSNQISTAQHADFWDRLHLPPPSAVRASAGQRADSLGRYRPPQLGFGVPTSTALNAEPLHCYRSPQPPLGNQAATQRTELLARLRSPQLPDDSATAALRAELARRYRSPQPSMARQAPTSHETRHFDCSGYIPQNPIRKLTPAPAPGVRGPSRKPEPLGYADQTLRHNIPQRHQGGVTDVPIRLTSQRSRSCVPRQPSEYIGYGYDKRFFCKKKLGEGSYGTVTLAWDDKTGKHVALKAIKSGGKGYVDPQNEIEILKRLSYRFIVKLYETFTLPNLDVYLVMEYLPGGDLQGRLRKLGLFNEADAMFYAYEIAKALGYLHEKKVIHRDLKPENIAIGPRGHISIIDFGFALDDRYGIESVGTKLYLAPEVDGVTPYTDAVDWYAFGVMLLDMIISFSKNPIAKSVIHGLSPRCGWTKLRWERLSEMKLEAQTLCYQLTEPDPNRRLIKADQVLNSEWFDTFFLHKMTRGKIIPPWVPG